MADLNDGTAECKVAVSGFELRYGTFPALKGLTACFTKNAITAIIGPSGCGKSTFLRSINRMNDVIEGVSTRGEIALDGVNVYGKDVDLTWLRSKIGMVFQRPVTFPLSVFDNVAVACRVQNVTNRARIEETVEQSLRSVALWGEVKDRLRKPATELSLGNQQKLSIARAVATRPQVVLLDEPCSALDPQATLKIEDLMWSLRESYTIIIVTHNMQQASRASDYTMFMLDGQIVEYRATKELFTNPSDVRTENYVTGRIG